MSSDTKTGTGSSEPEYWRSIEEWMDGAQFQQLMKDEFPEDASEWLDPVSRRQFLSLAAASVALAGAACNPSFKPASQQKVVPYVNQPDQMVPGVPLFFSTAMPQAGGVSIGLIVKSNEGRPTKVEGNPSHPSSLGGADLQSLAAPLTLYDPDRSRGCLNRGSGTTYVRMMGTIKQLLETQSSKQGEGIRILTEPTTSPTLIALMDELKKRYPKAKWLTYEPVSRDNIRKANLAAFGKPVNAVHHFDKADVILALDVDFLTSGPGSVRYARDFGLKRRVRLAHDHKHKHDHAKEVDRAGEKMNRLYAVEAMITSTGAIADHRLPLKPSEVEALARALAIKLGVAGVKQEGKLPELAAKWIEPLADDLLKHKGKAVVLAGEHQSAAVHLLVHAMNGLLEASGKTVTYTQPLDGNKGDEIADLKMLTDEMKAGKVELLLISGCNPVYDAPADLEFAKALAKVGTVVHHGLYVDETANPHAHWHINAAHFLESWGDSRGHDGTVAITQPLIAPLYQGKTLPEVIAEFVDAPIRDGLGMAKKTQSDAFDASKKSGDFDSSWHATLRYGVVEGSALPAIEVAKVNVEKLADKEFLGAPIKPGIEVQFRPDPVIYDGRQANNGWLQELPKPITNLTWDNAAMMSPRTADALKIEQSFAFTGGERGRTITDVITLKVNGKELKMAAHIVPSHADDVITLHLGFGRSNAGNTGGKPGGSNPVPGFNTYELRTTEGLWNAGGAEVARTGQNYSLAVAGAHAAMESRRPVRSATLEQFAKDPEFAQVPPTSAAEFEEIRANTPGTPENFELLKIEDRNPYYHKHEHEPHDKRLIPLSLYSENPIKVQGQDANKSYRRWAMTIDLGTCIGCSACTLACVAENNIPVVGKDQVSRGRAMHWIRIDRYYSIPGEKVMEDTLGAHTIKPAERRERIKDSSAIRTHVQPVPCQQCEKAPCEVVCPVGATVHSADGLNDMAYNRCVGTRYCSNNCPYKVRRFNFLQYTDYTTDTLKLLNNPEVTVRTRGVMEKCTYCVQRIRTAEIEAEREFESRPKDAVGRPKIFDGEVLTACQQACPTQAITFGDLNDPESAVLKTKAEEHNYGLLAELNTMPRTSYLAAIRNPNPKMPQGA